MMLLSWLEPHFQFIFPIHSFQERVCFFDILPEWHGYFTPKGKKCVVANRFGHFHHYSNFKLDKEIDIDIIVSFRFGFFNLKSLASPVDLNKFISRNVNQNSKWILIEMFPRGHFNGFRSQCAARIACMCALEACELVSIDKNQRHKDKTKIIMNKLLSIVAFSSTWPSHALVAVKVGAVTLERHIRIWLSLL